MARTTIWVGVEGADRFKRLSRDLREAGRGDLRRQLRREIRSAGRPVVRDVQTAVLGVQVSSSRGGHARPDRSTGLRQRVAKATTIAIRQNGIRIRVSARKVGPYGEQLPKYLDASLGRYDRWRHPVFGNRSVWTQQKGEPYFGRTILRHTRDFRNAIFKAMDDVAEEITE